MREHSRINFLAIIHVLINIIYKNEEVTEGKLVLSDVSRDIKDNKFLACGVEAQVNYIVTGDENLLVLNEYEEIKIITPREFHEILKG